MVRFLDGMKQNRSSGECLGNLCVPMMQRVIEIFRENVNVAIIDQNWKEHLRDMDDLKQSVFKMPFIAERSLIESYKL